MENKRGYLDLVSKAYENKSKKNLSIWDILRLSNKNNLREFNSTSTNENNFNSVSI
ncbi:MAG: hypothetical protein ACLTDM_18905 [Clostridium butyricum]